MARLLRILSTVLFAVAVAQAGFGSGFGASLIARDKSDALELAHRVNAWLVIVVAAVCVVATVLYRRRTGTTWPLVFAASLFGGALLQAGLGSARIAGPHLFLGVLYLCAATTFCSYAWRQLPSDDAVTGSGPVSAPAPPG